MMTRAIHRGDGREQDGVAATGAIRMSAVGDWLLARLTPFQWVILTVMALVAGAMWLHSGFDIRPGSAEGNIVVLDVLLGGAALIKAPAAERRVAMEDVAGSAAFATRREMRPLLSGLTPGGLLLGMHGRKSVSLPPERATHHTLVLGPIGSGKTRGFFWPNALAAIGAFVCTDPKGELWRETSGLHRDARRYAPTDPDERWGFNWLRLCGDARMADLLAAAAIQRGRAVRRGEQYYELSAHNLTKALCMHLAVTPEPSANALYALLGTGAQGVHKALAESPSEQARAIYQISLEGKRPAERADILSDVWNYLAWLGDEQVRAFCSVPETPDFVQAVDAGAGIYWCLPQADTERLETLSSIFFTVLLDQLARRTGERPVLLLFDEFANLGMLPHFPSTISVARDQGLALALGVQSLSQIEAIYGRMGRDAIVNCCGTKLVLHGLDGESAQWAERLLGVATVAVPNVRANADLQLRARPLLTADELRRLPMNELVCVSGNLRPMRLRKSSVPERH